MGTKKMGEPSSRSEITRPVSFSLSFNSYSRSKPSRTSYLPSSIVPLNQENRQPLSSSRSSSSNEDLLIPSSRSISATGQTEMNDLQIKVAQVVHMLNHDIQSSLPFAAIATPQNRTSLLLLVSAVKPDSSSSFVFGSHTVRAIRLAY